MEGTKLTAGKLGSTVGQGRRGRTGFVHYGADALPVLEETRKVVRVIAGSLLGASSAVKTSSPMFYADISLGAGASVPLDPSYDERAIYTVSGEVEIAGDVFGPAQLLVFRPETASQSAQTKTPASWRSEASPWTASVHLVELRLFETRSDRAGQGRLEDGKVRHRSGRQRVHPSSRIHRLTRAFNAAENGRCQRVMAGGLTRKAQAQLDPFE